MSENAAAWDTAFARPERRWESGEPWDELQSIAREGLVKPCRVLELGCGSGVDAVFLATQGFEVTAFDISKLAIEQAQGRASKVAVSVGFFQADVFQLPELGPPFPFVFDRGLYPQVRKLNLEGFREVLARVTQPGSLYLTMAPNAQVGDPSRRPPQALSADGLYREFSPLFDLVRLHECMVKMTTQQEHLVWSALLRRKSSSPQ